MRISSMTQMLPLIALLAAALLPGCQQGQRTGSTLNDRSTEQRRTLTAGADSSLEPAGLGDLDLGQDWDANADRRRPIDPSSRRLPADDAASRGPGSVWVVVLATFSGDHHVRAARTMLSEIRTMDPILADAWVHSTERGSIVALGRFESASDSAAHNALERVKSITINDRPVFARAMLSRVTLRAPGQLDPLALTAARQRYPNVDPLYTLDVALWMDDESDSVSYDQLKRRAEAYAHELRAKGFEAYFHHDEDKRMSTVTVGLFDHRAVDPQSGLVSMDVQALMDRFPARLVNGEPLRVPISQRKPELGTEVQKPFLVLVPRD